LYALLLNVCDHYNQFRFSAQGLMAHDQMVDRCSPAEPKVVAATWVFTIAANRLRFSAGGFEVHAVVNALNDTALQLCFEQELLGVNFDCQWTFKRY